MIFCFGELLLGDQIVIGVLLVSAPGRVRQIINDVTKMAAALGANVDLNVNVLARQMFDQIFAVLVRHRALCTANKSWIGALD